jgi:ATP-dependent Lhr-like helicase
MKNSLPTAFEEWFANRGWAPHMHQFALLTAARANQSALLVAPTGGGKTLAGFLPSLVSLAESPECNGLHTLYISPLKALAVDVQRNLEAPIAEMGLAITAESRTGDTPSKKRARQKSTPPHILLTTPESLALLLSFPEAPDMFSTLQTVIVDELHALADNKRGDLLSLGMSRLQTLAPGLRRVGLSATVADRQAMVRWLSPSAGRQDDVTLVIGRGGVKPDISIMLPEARMPWSGHMALYAIQPIYEQLAAHRTTIVFVNTRAQAELIFQALWHVNEQNLPIALHHGSLSAEQRRKVEAAMSRGALRAVVATSSLDLGIDWGDVDLVLQVGAPKGVSRLLQRIGRANHRLNEPSKAILVPANRFELLECQAAINAVDAGQLDGAPPQPGGLDVLAQHVVGIACSGPFLPEAFYQEVIQAGPYADLSREEFDDIINFIATGGYALGEYERYQRLRPAGGGRFGIAHQRLAQRYRLNVGTIVEAPTLKVRVGGRIVGQVEEVFVQGLVPGDTFMFAGQVLEFLGVREMMVATRRATGEVPKVPAYGGGRLPLTTHIADGVRAILADPKAWQGMPPDVLEWLQIQRWRSVLPKADGLLVETFPRGGKYFMVAYCFAGRNAHQTLGMLLTRRMQRAGLGPLGFVATDYVIAIWSLKEATDTDGLFAQDMLGDDLEEWMAESSLLKRTFRNVAVIAGLIERRQPGEVKTKRQVTFNSDLIYDVLRRHEPNHLLLRATRNDAARGLTDIDRLAELLSRVRGKITVRRLDRVSPLAVPVLLEVGREQVYDGAAIDQLLSESSVEDADALIAEAMADRGETLALPL